MEYLVRLPSFRALEDSIKNYRNKQHFNTDQRRRPPMDNKTSAKKRKLDSHGHISDDLEASFASNTNATSQNVEIQRKKGSNKKYVALQHLRYNKIKIQDIINPVMKSGSVHLQTSTRVAGKACLAHSLWNRVTQDPNGLMASQATRPDYDLGSPQVYPSPSLPFQSSFHDQIQEQNGLSYEPRHKDSVRKVSRNDETTNYPRCADQLSYPSLVPASHVTTHGNVSLNSSLRRENNPQSFTDGCHDILHNATNFLGTLPSPLSLIPHPNSEHSRNKGDLSIIRMYELGDIRRSNFTVVSGTVHNEQNHPTCTAPLENESPSRSKVSKGACKWHRDVKNHNYLNTNYGQLDGFGNIVHSRDEQDERIVAQGESQNPVQNGQIAQAFVSQRVKPRAKPRVLRWSNEEHFWFLFGYTKLGKKWSLISKVVQTRTTLQVQSHAQKYFDRRNKENKMKSTIHDLTPESEEMQKIGARIAKEVKEARLALASAETSAVR